LCLQIEPGNFMLKINYILYSKKYYKILDYIVPN
jgi:hypothetical protein